MIYNVITHISVWGSCMFLFLRRIPALLLRRTHARTHSLTQMLELQAKQCPFSVFDLLVRGFGCQTSCLGFSDTGPFGWKTFWCIISIIGVADYRGFRILFVLDRASCTVSIVCVQSSL